MAIKQYVEEVLTDEEEEDIGDEENYPQFDETNNPEETAEVLKNIFIYTV